MTWREDAAEQNLRMANKMLEQQGEISQLRADLAVARAELAAARAELSQWESGQRALATLGRPHSEPSVEDWDWNTGGAQ